MKINLSNHIANEEEEKPKPKKKDQNRNRSKMISFKCLQRRLHSIDKWFLVLYVVLAVVLVSIHAADGLSTTKERGMYFMYLLICSRNKIDDGDDDA